MTQIYVWLFFLLEAGGITWALYRWSRWCEHRRRVNARLDAIARRHAVDSIAARYWGG